MVTLTEAWKKVERGVVYGLFFVFVLTEALSAVLHRAILGSHGELVLLGLTLLGAFRLLDERLPKLGKATGPIRHSFGDAVTHTIGSETVLKSLDIFAHTSSKYCEFVRDNKIRVESLRLLICSATISTAAVRHELELTIRHWKRLENDGVIGSLEIRYYPFLPSFHFMVANRRRVQFGLFRYTDGGFRVLKSFVFESDDLSARLFSEDLIEFFETIFTQFSQEGNYGDSAPNSKA